MSPSAEVFSGYRRRRAELPAPLRRFGLVALALQALVILALLVIPVWRIAPLATPSLHVTLFSAAPPPPPPPPPPPAGGGPEKAKLEPEEPKEETKPEEPEPLVEPSPEDEPKEPEPTPESPPSPGVPGGVEGGEEGGVVGGVVGGVQGGVVGGVLGGQLPKAPPAKFVATPPKVLEQTPPEYPPLAYAQGITGMVVTKICIDSTGRVTDVVIFSAKPGFDEAVRKAVRTWRFAPYRPGGTAVPACFPWNINFTLKR